jgi:tetratricopeptide (TPR) repeat protein
MGNPNESRRYLDASLQKVRDSLEPDTYVDPYFNAAYVAWLSNEPAAWRAGLDLARQVTAFWRNLKSQYPLSFALDMEARLLLSLGEAGAALELSTEAVRVIESSSYATSLNQFYYTLARALRAAGQTEKADEALKQAYDWVMQVAGRLTEKPLRRSWLENVRYNRAIVQDWEARRGIKSL